MFFSLLHQWLLAPITHYRLFHNFVRQDFNAQFAGSLGGILWLFIIGLVVFTITYGIQVAVWYRYRR